MTSENINLAHSYAKSHVKELKQKYPEAFTKTIGLLKATELARMLRVRVKQENNTVLEGYIEIKNQSGVIVLNKNLSIYKRRRIIFHEIGHWILRMHYPDLNAKNSLEWKEAYANEFAHEMLRIKHSKNTKK